MFNYQISCSCDDNVSLDCCKICQNLGSVLFCCRFKKFSQRHLCIWPKGHCCCCCCCVVWWSLAANGIIFDKIFQVLVKADGKLNQNGILLNAFNWWNKFNSIKLIKKIDWNINIDLRSFMLQRILNLQSKLFQIFYILHWNIDFIQETQSFYYDNIIQWIIDLFITNLQNLECNL